VGQAYLPKILLIWMKAHTAPPVGAATAERSTWQLTTAWTLQLEQCASRLAGKGGVGAGWGREASVRVGMPPRWGAARRAWAGAGPSTDRRVHSPKAANAASHAPGGAPPPTPLRRAGARATGGPGSARHAAAESAATRDDRLGRGRRRTEWPRTPPPPRRAAAAGVVGDGWSGRLRGRGARSGSGR
jgi:hypothetical protein